MGFDSAGVPLTGSRNVLLHLIGQGQIHYFREEPSREMRSVLPAVAEQLFRDIEKIYQETSQSKKSMHEEVKVIIASLVRGR